MNIIGMFCIGIGAFLLGYSCHRSADASGKAGVRIVKSRPGNIWPTIEVDTDRFYIRGGKWGCAPSTNPLNEFETWVQRGG